LEGMILARKKDSFWIVKETASGGKRGKEKKIGEGAEKGKEKKKKKEARSLLGGEKKSPYLSSNP